VLLGVVGLVAKGAAPPPLLTAQQKAKLAERDRLEKQLSIFIQKGQYDWLLEAAERIVALEKEALGQTHLKVLASLRRLAAFRQLLGKYPGAIRAREEVLKPQQKRLRKGHWQVTDARLELEHTRRLAAMSDQQRSEVVRAEAWRREVGQLHRQG